MPPNQFQPGGPILSPYPIDVKTVSMRMSTGTAGSGSWPILYNRASSVFSDDVYIIGVYISSTIWQYVVGGSASLGNVSLAAGRDQGSQFSFVNANASGATDLWLHNFYSPVLVLNSGLEFVFQKNVGIKFDWPCWPLIHTGSSVAVYSTDTTQDGLFGTGIATFYFVYKNSLPKFQ